MAGLPTLVLAGRDTTTLRSTLTRNTATTDLKMVRLDETRRRDLVANAIGVEPGDVADVVAEAERAFGEVANNPMMLLLGIRTILLDGDASNPSRIFRTVVRAIAEENGYQNVSQYEIGLGMAFSRLLDGGKRYTDTFGWVTLLNNVATALTSRGHHITAEELREFGSETGLVRVSQLDSVRPLHDSFADYLAAAALHMSMASLPEPIRGLGRPPQMCGQRIE